MATRRWLTSTGQGLAKKYTKEHEWIEFSSSTPNAATIGISTYAAHSLGDVVYVELPTKGQEAGVGDAIGAVESVKSASDINAPVSCRIVEVNELLEEKPSTINQGPEDVSSAGGWFAKVEVSEMGIKEADALMGEDEYKKYTEDA